MANYIGHANVWKYILAYLDGGQTEYVGKVSAPGNFTGMAHFLIGEGLTPADVAESLSAVGQGDMNTVTEFVKQHPELAAWFASAA
jgi:hypothetical protein